MGASPTTSPPAGSTNHKSAPLGIKIICILGVLVSLLTFFMSLRIMAAGGQFFAFGMLLIFLTVAYLAVVYGLWTVQPWGWTWGMIVFAFGAIMDLIQMQIFGLLVSLVVIAYLYSKKDYYRR